jgi:electron transfer flavoprotein beta subunit
LRIVVLTKPVPDPTASERLGADGRVDRSGSNVINGNDEYALEAALKLVEAQGGDVTVVAMSPDSGRDVIRKGLAMGATNGVLITDPALAGSDWLATTRVLAAAVKDTGFDLLLLGVDTSDGGAGLTPAGLAATLGLPYLSNAASIEPADGVVRVKRITATGFETLEAPTPAVIGCTQALGAPRYPTLKGIMGARSKEVAVKSLADLGLDASRAGGANSGTKVVDLRQPPARGETRVIRGPAADAAKEVVDFLATRGLV